MARVARSLHSAFAELGERGRVGGSVGLMLDLEGGAGGRRIEQDARAGRRKTARDERPWVTRFCATASAATRFRWRTARWRGWRYDLGGGWDGLVLLIGGLSFRIGWRRQGIGG